MAVYIDWLGCVGKGFSQPACYSTFAPSIMGTHKLLLVERESYKRSVCGQCMSVCKCKRFKDQPMNKNWNGKRRTYSGN